MNEKKLIQELISQYGLKLKENDPIFAGLFLNKIAMREYLEEFENHLAESITNVAIKEDVTLRKLQKIYNEAQTKNRQETERVLNQFADNLHGRLYTLLNQPDPIKSSKLWLWCILCLMIGFIFGIGTGRYI